MKNTATEIHPESLVRFGNLELLAKAAVEGFITGLHKSPFHGFSVEFAEHRQYNTGESTRHIDWKLFARTEKLFVKKYEEETNLRCRIVIDRSAGMYFPFDSAENKIRFSVYAAASLIELLRRQRDAVGITLYDDDIRFASQVKSGLVHIRSLYLELEKLLAPFTPGTGHRTSTPEILHQIADTIHRRSLVIVFSDFFSDYSEGKTPQSELEKLMEAIRHLRHNKHEVILFRVTDKKLETDFAFDNRPYLFIDPETGNEVRLNPTEIREAYKATVKNMENELRLLCGQHGVDYNEADIREGLFKVMTAFMTKRQKML
jgi:uncharacterized protein (DUF58 family)